MPDINIPYAQPGVASFEMSDDYVNEQLLMGSHPIQSPAASGEAGAAIAVRQVVGFSAGKVVPATWNADPALAVAPVGIAATASDGLGTNPRVLYWYAGHYNIDLLVFDATFNTDAKKLAAFNGAPTPTNIRLSSRSA